MIMNKNPRSGVSAERRKNNGGTANLSQMAPALTRSALRQTVNMVARGYQLNQRVLELIWLERLRQIQLLADGKHKYTCATAGIAPEWKLCILTEEVGEVARAIDQIRNHPL